MSKQIADFLVELSKDPLLADQFKKDRFQVVAQAGFTGCEAELLLSSDVGMWRENFSAMRANAEPNGDIVFNEEPNGIGEEPPARRKKPAKKPKKPKATKKPASKTAKKPAKKKKGGRK
jgi:hypothetical protein